MNMEDMVGYDEPCFVISVAARIVGVQTQTLRYYERIGLVEPRRTSGNQRMYSRREVERVQRIRSLIDDLGVNLAGVEVLIKLMDRLQQSEEEKDELRGRIRVLEQRLRAASRQMV
jgi:MerR family transcriptional regulator/heat shock protein HspR